MSNRFNVLNWNINRNELESYDVLPYFRKCYEECKKKKINLELLMIGKSLSSVEVCICTGQDVSMR